MELTTADVIEVEKHLEEHKGITFVFAPKGVSPSSDYKPELYLAWLRSQYPDIVFEYTCSMGSFSMATKITEYLSIKWYMRNMSLGIIRHNMVRLRDEIAPLRVIKQTLCCLKQAQAQMDKLRIWTIA